MTRAKSRVAGVLAVMLAATLTVSLVAPVTAGARSISDVRAEAARIEQQIQENGDRIAALGEEFNAAELGLRSLETDQALALRQVQQARAKARSLRSSVAALAARLYMSNAMGSNAVQSVDVGSVMYFTRSQQHMAAIRAKDLDILDHLQGVQVELGRRRESLQRSVSVARAQRAIA